MPDPAPQFAEEGERLRVLENFAPEELTDDPELQSIVNFAARLCNSPAAMVTILDLERQLFLARIGVEERETPKDISFCVHALGSAETLEILDATADERFAQNPLVTGSPGVRYYAGQPLVSDEGAPLGTLCVIDTVPHTEPLDDFQREGLYVLARAAMRRLNARRTRLSAERALVKREELLRRMIDGVPQIAWSADADGNFDYFNRRWSEITGDAPPRLAEDWRPYIHPDDAEAAYAEWNRCFASGEDFEAEFRFRHADGSWAWVLSLAVPVVHGEGDPGRWFGTITDIDEVRRALDERDMLAKELSHRIKNIFAVVIGLATLKARKSPEHEPFAKELSAVLRALNRAHEFVRPHEGPVQERLTGLLDALFAPYSDRDGQPRVRVSGAEAAISPRAATPLALVFHELATNSAKYGALSAPGGHVDLKCEDKGEQIALSWSEHGGPKVTETGESGFGSRLVELSVTGQLQGSWERRFEEDGLVVELVVSKEAIAG